MSRIFVEWETGEYVSSLDSEFQSVLKRLTAKNGPPTKVEFRADGEGWSTGGKNTNKGDPMARIVIDIPDTVEPSEVEQILRDAIGEFWRVRSPAPDYVERRYGDPGGLIETLGRKWQSEKLASVERRIGVAQSLTLRVEQDVDPDGVAASILTLRDEQEAVEALDEMVHELCSSDASDINNGGLYEQVKFLLERGCANGDILDYIKEA